MCIPRLQRHMGSCCWRNAGLRERAEERSWQVRSGGLFGRFLRDLHKAVCFHNGWRWYSQRAGLGDQVVHRQVAYSVREPSSHFFAHVTRPRHYNRWWQCILGGKIFVVEGTHENFNITKISACTCTTYTFPTYKHCTLPYNSPAIVKNGLDREQGKAAVISRHTLIQKHRAFL